MCCCAAGGLAFCSDITVGKNHLTIPAQLLTFTEHRTGWEVMWGPGIKTWNPASHDFFTFRSLFLCMNYSLVTGGDKYWLVSIITQLLTCSAQALLQSTHRSSPEMVWSTGKLWRRGSSFRDNSIRRRMWVLCWKNSALSLQKPVSRNDTWKHTMRKDNRSCFIRNLGRFHYYITWRIFWSQNPNIVTKLKGVFFF